MNKFLDYNQLTLDLRKQYLDCVSTAFPQIILESELVKNLWVKVESYFPNYQRSFIKENNKLMGVVNTIPFYWYKDLNDLPNDGWDWLMKKGIHDFENNIKPNSLGGLQIILTKENQGKGFSKLLIAEGRNIQKRNNLTNFVIPIRPTFKYKHPKMLMNDYINLKQNNKIFDPWIRTHVKSGAKVLKVCSNSMNVHGNVKMWEALAHKRIAKSGGYIIEGALNPVTVNVAEDYGEYREENVWIFY